jgi:hypothetical protein
VSAVSPELLLAGCGLLVREGGAACDVKRSSVRKTVRLVLIIFNEITALFIMSKIRGILQLNIDILMYSSHRD